MRNLYEVRGDVIAIQLNQGMETLIDKKDLELADSFPYTWTARKKKGNKYYVEGGMKNDDGTYTTVRLHRWLMNNPKGLVVDHKNHDTLDNRRSTNLRAVTNKVNTRNRKGNNPGSSTGVRNVSRTWNGKFQVRLGIDGKLKHFGTYEDLDEADRVAREARLKYYGSAD